MPFAQVTEDKNGQKVLVPITESTSTTAADALALAENALPLDGSKEMTGNLILQLDAAAKTDPTNATSRATRFIGNDGQIVASLLTSLAVDGSRSIMFQPVTQNNIPSGNMGVQLNKDGTAFAWCPNPDSATAPNNAIMTKKTVADNYLAKAGGEVTGSLSISDSDFDDEDTSAQHWSKQFAIKKDGHYWGYIQLMNDFGILRTQLQLHRTINNKNYASGINVCVDSDGTTYATAPNPRTDNYGSDIVTMKAMKDYAPMNLTEDVDIHVNAETGSDTADLFAGRGFSAEKPFKSLDGAVKWVSSKIHGPYTINMILHSDITAASFQSVYLGNSLLRYYLQSDSTKRSVNLTNAVLRNGCLLLKNIHIAIGAGARRAITVTGGEAVTPLLYIGTGVEISGAVSEQAFVSAGALIRISAPISGNVTGSKYRALDGGMIIGVSNIPGTVDGICDANSKAFG